MADYQGGPYTPGDEAPLAFERRRREQRPPPRRSGPPPITLILSAVVLLGVGGAVAFMYRAGLRGPTAAPRPVGTPIQDVRVAAPPQAQAADPAAGLTIYKEGPPAAAPAFTPPPEQPTPRPTLAPPAPSASAATVQPQALAAPSAPAIHASPHPTRSAAAAEKPKLRTKTPTIDSLIAENSRSGSTAATSTSEAAHARKTAEEAGQTAAAKPELATAKAKAKAKKVDEAKKAKEKLLAETAAEKAPAAKPSTAGPIDAKGKVAAADAVAKPGHGAVVQIGAFSSRDLANAAAGRGAGAGRSRRIVPVSRPDGSVLYRTSLTGFASRDEAAAFCAKLKASGGSCFVPR